MATSFAAQPVTTTHNSVTPTLFSNITTSSSSASSVAHQAVYIWQTSLFLTPEDGDFLPVRRMIYTDLSNIQPGSVTVHTGSAPSSMMPRYTSVNSVECPLCLAEYEAGNLVFGAACGQNACASCAADWLRRNYECICIKHPGRMLGPEATRKFEIGTGALRKVLIQSRHFSSCSPGISCQCEPALQPHDSDRFDALATTVAMLEHKARRFAASRLRYEKGTGDRSSMASIRIYTDSWPEMKDRGDHQSVLLDYEEDPRGYQLARMVCATAIRVYLSFEIDKTVLDVSDSQSIVSVLALHFLKDHYRSVSREQIAILKRYEIATPRLERFQNLWWPCELSSWFFAPNRSEEAWLDVRDDLESYLERWGKDWFASLERAEESKEDERVDEGGEQEQEVETEEQETGDEAEADAGEEAEAEEDPQEAEAEESRSQRVQ